MKLTTEGLAFPNDIKSRPVCGVVVVAAAAGITFTEAWSIVAAGRGRFDGRTHEHERNRVMQMLGVTLSRIHVERCTLNALAKRLDPNRRYIVRTRGHVQIVHRGHILDQGGWSPISPQNGRARKFVTSVLRIEEADHDA